MKRRLTKLQKRMLVLKDALKQIKIGFLKPLHIGVLSLPTIDEEDEKADAQLLLKRLQKEKKSCSVCARGGLLLATVARFDKFTVGDLLDAESDASYYYSSTTDVKLSGIFSEKQLQMFETAFEGSCNYSGLGSQLFDACCNFADRYKDPKKRLIAILENAVKNKGTFIP